MRCFCPSPISGNSICLTALSWASVIKLPATRSQPNFSGSVTSGETQRAFSKSQKPATARTDNAIILMCRGDHSLGLLTVHGPRFFAKHVSTRLKRGTGQVAVGRWRRGDDNYVVRLRRLSKHGLCVLNYPPCGIAFFEPRAGLLIRVRRRKYYI